MGKWPKGRGHVSTFIGRRIDGTSEGSFVTCGPVALKGADLHYSVPKGVQSCPFPRSVSSVPSCTFKKAPAST